MRDIDYVLALFGGILAYILFKSRAAPETTEEGPPMTPLQATVMAYRSIIMAERKQGVAPAMIAAVIAAESEGDPSAKTWEPKVSEYSYGLMQVLGSTALWLCKEKGITYSGRCYTKDELLDPNANIHYGTAYLRYQLFVNKFYPDRAVAAYNAGTAMYNIWGKLVNQGYVDKVLDYIDQFRPLFEFYYPGQV